MSQRNAERFINDLLEDRQDMREKLANHFNGQPFRVEDLALASQVHGYTFTAEDFRNAYDADQLRQRELRQVLTDDLGWTEPDWVR